MKWVMAVFAGLLFVCPAFAEEAVVGRASVVDGDTIEIAGERVRLHSRAAAAPNVPIVCCLRHKTLSSGRRGAPKSSRCALLQTHCLSTLTPCFATEGISSGRHKERKHIAGNKD